ncbi:MAG: sugar ABC transporter permease [Chloroflexi bacterium]|nr:sugar ABC transporter permease [Chloroflexota bacterium]MCL5947490.1 sugar ABC transporter permease [Chloroflexota bacterium]
MSDITITKGQAGVRPATHRIGRLTRAHLRNGLLFISPWIFGFLAFQVYPIIASLYYSFTNYTVLKPPVFIGTLNYVDLFKDPLVRIALGNTLYLTLVGVPFSTVIAIGLALLLNVKVRGQALFRTVFYLPTVVPVVATSALFLWILNPQFGLINEFLALFGIVGPGWLATPLWAKPALILLQIWGVGGSMVIYLASLQDVPAELHEAAQIDGAGAIRRTFTITLPLITPVIFFNVVVGLIGYFQYFTQAYIMTQGGPANSTLVYALYLYNNAFEYFHMGYASALAWVLFIIILAATMLLFRTAGRWVFYAGQ